MEHVGGMILTGENRRTRRKTCPSATLSTTNPTWIDPGANPGLRSERPATNHLNHDTANLHILGLCYLTRFSSLLVVFSLSSIFYLPLTHFSFLFIPPYTHFVNSVDVYVSVVWKCCMEGRPPCGYVELRWRCDWTCNITFKRFRNCATTNAINNALKEISWWNREAFLDWFTA
jgi:hypothetical protein